MQTVTSTVYTNKLLTDGRTDTRRHAQRTSHDHISSPCHFMTVVVAVAVAEAVAALQDQCFRMIKWEKKKMFTNCLQTDRRTDGRRTLSDHNSSPRAIAQETRIRPGTTDPWSPGITRPSVLML
ncbi:hypothetical protein DPMN_110830 [Dreissena polymorpha]|uniref:Uncharacterized protein n=1 Tax=Dreissena polymorpha TaxID=45954 RepID=A0A9D4KCQ9_DREPO|nr:hypothetical protein DPMN_110830 [Dreissena polymorpha]